jgi:RNA polymerase sigma factor (sigma-70 family)
MISNQSSPKDTDLQLWSNIRNGEKDSLSSLYNLYYLCLFNYGYKIVPREQFIEDCIQELFLTIWEQRNTISKVFSVKSYLYVSMKRMVFSKLNKYRNYQKRNTRYAEDFQEDTLDFESWIIAQEFQAEYKYLVDVAIQELSNRQKEVIKLKYNDGLSTSEIANLLEINRQSVYNHVSEALKQLKTYVHETPKKIGTIESPLYANESVFSYV